MALGIVKVDLKDAEISFRGEKSSRKREQKTALEERFAQDGELSRVFSQAFL